MKVRKFFKHLFGIFAFFVMVTFSFSAAYFTVSYIYHLFDFHTSNYIHHLVTTILGFFILAGVAFSLSIIIRSRQRNLFQEVIGALRRIAQGDFNVQLEKLKKEDPFTTLIDHINHMAKQLKQMEDMRQEFISNVSHEIQSPLTSISGFARALQYDQLSQEERAHYLSIIETESKRLSKLSDNLLKLTSLESKNHPFDQKNYRLDQQIRNIILACEPQWVEKELEMDVSLEKVTFVGDEDLMNQVWTNLIHNSIKFTPSLGRIRVHLQQIDHKAIVKISDTGIGILKEDQVRIFERFFKADKARERSKGGSGLGLSIVKKIIEMHKGTIFVNSEEGRGTIFTISIPIQSHLETLR
ncbi:sensor histidine kinase [Aneurinibacillus aneurinilyticus]|jgi:signal transduction histidine kinase|uniref:histidine kinase n=1 Tax=Aneurinibacillus aneurinilyticus TaxID=1391 RepID=A0A848CZ13_ANEAE|nr:HAMP domain-containing sensor histidine kinase [Aneurinibacillus aneurinilyticus]NME98732.1 two-component sensor histidine kinase [Aneurinibacillus aneurinilyticus]